MGLLGETKSSVGHSKQGALKHALKREGSGPRSHPQPGLPSPSHLLTLQHTGIGNAVLTSKHLVAQEKQNKVITLDREDLMKSKFLYYHGNFK